MNRGAVPLRIVNHVNSANFDVIFSFDDLERVANGGWLPRRRLHIIGKGEVVDQLIVKQIDVQLRPDLSLYKLEFPEPIGLTNQAKQLTYSKRQNWSLLNLPSEHASGTRPFRKSSIPPLELPSEVAHSDLWSIIVPTLLVFMAIASTIIFFKRRGRRLKGA
jgi:hypothetical protein